MNAPEATEWDPMVRLLLAQMLKCGASDLYITAESPPMFRINGDGFRARSKLESEHLERMAESMMTPDQREEFAQKYEMNLALALGTEGRFRANLFRQRGTIGMVFRLVRTQIQTLAELRHPAALATVSQSRRGLVLLVGGTGSGKSTTLAAMIDHRNATETGHIITIEDPIEFIHEPKKCVVTQREVGTDTLSFAAALKNTLRQAPDVILIGEIRDSETMEAALAFAETGHLCLSTLHANNANQALERILNFFPPARHREICLQLSLNLRAVISQRLVASEDGGRAAALEIMLDTPRIKELIKRGETDQLKAAIDQGAGEGCATFDASLFGLFAAGKITRQNALQASDSRNNLRLRIERFIQSGGAPGQASDRSERPVLRLMSTEPATEAR